MNHKIDVQKRPWTVHSEDLMFSCPIFKIKRMESEHIDQRKNNFYVIENPDFVNIIPVTAQNEVILVKQFRFGINDFSLELPGGLVEPYEKPQAAALRELKEETGYGGDRIVLLGKTRPNSAFHNNWCHSFLIPEAEIVGPTNFDENEDLDIVKIYLQDIPEILKNGKLNHALVLNAFFFYHLHQVSLGNADPWKEVIVK